jgi:hypothetical protein
MDTSDTTPGNQPTLPTLDRPTPIHSADDLLRRWQALMTPLGFAHRTLWYGFIDPAGYFAPAVQQLDHLPPEPHDRLVFNLIAVCGRLLAATDHISDSVAFLLSRPGDDQVTRSDEAWARALLDAARQAGLSLQPMHLATDQSIRPLDPGQLVAA